MADTLPSETVTPEAPSNNATPTATPVVNADAAEVERLKKEADQAKMRANQLQNQLDEQAKAKEAEQQKRLEEQNEWKQVAEQNKAKLEAYEKEREEAEARQELTNASNQILSTFSSEVQEEAKALGISLLSTDDSSKESFKAKLDRLSAKVSATATPSANNPSVRTVSDDDLLRRIRTGDRQAREQAIGNLQAVKTMRELSGYQN